jgi:hypothetical protein
MMVKRLNLLAISQLFSWAIVSNLLTGIARAELPPGTYDDLRIGASEALIVQILSVKTKKGSEAGLLGVTVKAKAIAVQRSKTGVKKGSEISIQYTNDSRNIPGAREIPVLKKGEIYPAFLSRSNNAKIYQPVAYGESFNMTPEK